MKKILIILLLIFTFTNTVFAQFNSSLTSISTTTPTTLTSGSVLFSNGSFITQNNTNFFWDNSNLRLGIGTTSPGEKLHIDAAGGTDGTGFWIANASVSTTDATLTTIYTVATTTDRAYRVLWDYIGAQDDGSNSMGALHSFTIKNVGGTVTEQGDISIQETDDSAGIVLSGAVSGTNYLIQVTAIASENWNHEGTIRATIVAH